MHFIVALAAQSPDVAPVLPQIDITSYAGIGLAVFLVIGATKRLFKQWIDGKEPIVSLILTLVVGIVAKLAGEFGPGNLKGWLVHVILLLIVAGGIKIGHDALWNAVLGKDSSPK